ncbi:MULTISPECIES: LLM class F420-dependent oxidoreductase [Thermomonospora]|uniref:Luciferase-like monooxygenase n=1 Tax=Thermomonospora curvata (strain ATCC 19995 / DSM 43183 / JCM 3096 / KCTC 9072 / NBRC 15933 / NCIMB 10081 / Henssen B9) TaxID=471852 RepID=D1ABN8_THECD|nr:MULTISPECIES: LLM class F420-dependent oxidoreductase [Thermomonospora]ACY99061.1 Luciferase-like monooxygenase [Thermomonospora curvata DSM 43183]PKK13245.1 MAG: TIGR03619 family F420-dependent LLM class oxidoreductase [Thermomonospora sp. CIF 1]
MRIGIVTPVVAQPPGAHSPWEHSAGIEELGRIAEAADRLGYHHLTCSEHVAVPTEAAAQRGGVYWDPLATFGYLAARTRRIRLATQVLVLGYHHPLAIAKRYGTLDRVSGGRLVLGLGVGSLAEEFALLGAPFEGRGPRADEAIAALRAAWGRREPSFHGEHYDFSGFVVEPHAVRERVPIWIGGRTARSLRRAVTLGDGWVPFGLPLDTLAEMLAKADAPEGFEVVLSPGRPLDPLGSPEAARTALERLRKAGATIAGVRLTATSADHYCDQLAALRELGQSQGLSFAGD